MIVVCVFHVHIHAVHIVRGRGRVGAIAGAGLEGKLLRRGGCAEGKRLQPFVAVLCESLCASYGDIAVIVPATLLRLLLAPLLERHGVTRSGGGCDMLATMLGNGFVSQKRVSTLVGSVVYVISLALETHKADQERSSRGPCLSSLSSSEGLEQHKEAQGRRRSVPGTVQWRSSQLGAMLVLGNSTRCWGPRTRRHRTRLAWLVVSSEVGTVEASMQRGQQERKSVAAVAVAVAVAITMAVGVEGRKSRVVS